MYRYNQHQCSLAGLQPQHSNYTFVRDEQEDTRLHAFPSHQAQRKEDMFDRLVQQHLALCSEIVAHKHAQSLASPYLHDKLYALLKVHMSIKKIELPI